MAFDSFADFLAMGGYGVYVWASYGLTLLVVAFMLIPPLRQRGQLQRQLAQQQRRQAAASNDQTAV